MAGKITDRKGLLKVLIITYYWPPAGGGGVQRWLKFTKYLREFGIEPVIFTVRDGESPVEDHSLASEIPSGVRIIRRPIWEPYGFYKKLIGKKKEDKVYSGFIQEKKKAGWQQKLSVFIRGNFFIPDARMFWIRPSVKFLRTWLEDNSIDCIISTGPPHSTHRIAFNVTRKFDIPWIADFRDPWTNIDFYHQLKLTRWADARHRNMELQVLKSATEVVTVSQSWAEDFKKIHPRALHVINNGFDPEDFNGVSTNYPKKFSILHAGSMNADRNPGVLWEVLADLVKKVPGFSSDLQIRLIGNVDISILEDIKVHGLDSYKQQVAFLAHKEIPAQMASSAILLLPINNTPNVGGVIPGKLYEYLGAKRPILCVGPASNNSAQIVLETNGGAQVDYSDREKMKQQLLTWYGQFKQGVLSVDSSGIDKYSRKQLAGKFSELIKSITN